MTFATWREAHDWAQEKANESGRSRGIEKPTEFRKEWNVIMLPLPKNRCGHELRCEVVDPEVLR